MGERIGQQPFSRLNSMRIRPRSRSCCLGRGASLRRAGRPELVSVTQQGYRTHRTAGWRLAAPKRLPNPTVLRGRTAGSFCWNWRVWLRRTTGPHAGRGSGAFHAPN